MAMERLNISRRKSRSGDACQCAKCRGHLKVKTTIVKEDEGVRVQYLACTLCNFKPDDNKIIVPLDFAPPRDRK
jgi:hypothetical protein